MENGARSSIIAFESFDVKVWNCKTKHHLLLIGCMYIYIVHVTLLNSQYLRFRTTKLIKIEKPIYSTVFLNSLQ